MAEYFGDSLLKHPQEPAFLCAAVKPGMKVLEIGTWHGRTAAYMADACPEALILSLDVMTWPPLAASEINWFKNRRPNMRLPRRVADRPACPSVHVPNSFFQGTL